MKHPPLISTAILLSCCLTSFADTLAVKTDATWRTIKAAQYVGTDWNSAVVYDDSDQAGWTNAFKSPNGDRIWHTSNLSSESPTNPRFRHLFEVYGPVSSCVAHFYFDDDATVWVNGVEVLNDTDGGATTFDNISLDPALFLTGTNVIAVWGHNTTAPYNNIEIDLTLTVVPPRPIILVNDGHFGFQSGHFGFTISANPGQPVTVETSIDLTNWLPLATNTLTSATLYYSDPSSSTPQTPRFYRLRSP